jgi:hypothetical protein
MPHKKAKKTDEVSERKSYRRSVDEYSQVMRNEKPKDNLFAAFLPKPRKLSINILSEYEQIILILRQHPITQVKWILIIVVLIFLPILFGNSGVFDFLPVKYQFAASLGWYLFIFGMIIESFLKWFYRVYIITDERLIDVDFLSMVYKNISTTKIDKIEDITSINTGFFASLVDYGTIIIQTAATKQELHFERVPHPSKVTSLINELILEEELEKIEGRVS